MPSKWGQPATEPHVAPCLYFPTLESVCLSASLYFRCVLEIALKSSYLQAKYLAGWAISQVSSLALLILASLSVPIITALGGFVQSCHCPQSGLSINPRFRILCHHSHHPRASHPSPWDFYCDLPVSRIKYNRFHGWQGCSDPALGLPR